MAPNVILSCTSKHGKSEREGSCGPSRQSHKSEVYREDIGQDVGRKSPLAGLETI